MKVEHGSRDRADAILGFMPPQHRHFYARLSYFVVGTLDSEGRPWVSIVTGEQGFLRPVSQNHLALVTDISEGDPLLETLKDGFTVSEGEKLIAGLGIDFTNRRRNKGRSLMEFKLTVVAGKVAQNMVCLDNNELQMIINATEALGNCPKVIARGQ